MINWNISQQDARIILEISRRAVQEKLSLSAQDTAMDITATHLNGCPLRLKDLLFAESFDFIHDIEGICRHLDRDTGKLRNHFTPRYAVPSKGQAA